MLDHKIAFDTMEWEETAPGARQKAVCQGGTTLRMVEFSREFVEDGWCTNGHVGYVLDGDLDVDFDGSIVRFTAGDGVFIPAGDRHRHKPTAVSDVVRLLLVEHA
jgi:quercetin dioxygenase-like cupin family protein